MHRVRLGQKVLKPMVVVPVAKEDDMGLTNGLIENDMISQGSSKIAEKQVKEYTKDVVSSAKQMGRSIKKQANSEAREILQRARADAEAIALETIGKPVSKKGAISKALRKGEGLYANPADAMTKSAPRSKVVATGRVVSS